MSTRSNLRGRLGLCLLVMWPTWVAAQVAPEAVGAAQLQASVRAVLGTEAPVAWTAVPLDAALRERLTPELKRRRPLPDTLFLGRIDTPDGPRYLIPDEAPSRSETFSFVLYLDEEGGIVDVDVLQYRENYGAEIDYPVFRRQFHGRKRPGEVRFRRTIQNISGATISARSITHAVHDLLILVGAVGLDPPERP